MENICECSLNFSNKAALTIHKKFCNFTESDIKDIRNDYISGFSIKDLQKKYNCGKAILKNILNGLIRNLSEACKLGAIKYPIKHTEVSKEKIRIARIKWMKENPQKTAWRSTSPSYIEKCFKKYIIENNWIDHFLITPEKSVFPYFIDFAFENEKIAVELDGSQHLNEEIIEKDNKKDSKLNEEGWVVYRITGGAIVNNIQPTMLGLFNFLKNKSISSVNIKVGLNDYKKKRVLDRPSRNGIYRTTKEKESSFKQRKVKDRPSLEILENDVTILGYRGTGRKYNVSDNCIKKWLINYKKLK